MVNRANLLRVLTTKASYTWTRQGSCSCARPTAPQARGGSLRRPLFERAVRTAFEGLGPPHSGPFSSCAYSRSAWRNCLKILSTGQPPHHQACHRCIDERFSGCTQSFIILAHPAVLREPGEGALHHPSAR